MIYKKFIPVYPKSINLGEIAINGPSLKSLRPGTGEQPPELAGRDGLLDRLAITFRRDA